MVVDRVSSTATTEKRVAAALEKRGAAPTASPRAARRRATARARGADCPVRCAPDARGAAARAVLLRVAARRVPRLPRLRAHHRHRSRQGDPGRVEDAGRARDSPLDRQEHELGARRAREALPAPRRPDRRAVGEAHARAAESSCSRATAAGEKGKFPGVLGWFRWLETRTYKMHVRVLLSRYRSYDLCRACGGQALERSRRSRTASPASISPAWHALEISEARARSRRASRRSTGQGELARRELASRLGYLERVGLGYLTLDRQARTLSGGEAQRVTLTAALGTSLHNALFVLDEPTVGLHPPTSSRSRACCASSPSAATPCSSSSTIRRSSARRIAWSSSGRAPAPRAGASSPTVRPRRVAKRAARRRARSRGAQSRSRAAARGARRARSCARRARTTCETWTSSSRSGSCAPSRDRAARARARSWWTSCTARSRASSATSTWTCRARTTRIDGAEADQARHPRRSVAARAHVARQRRDLHEGVGRDAPRCFRVERRERSRSGSPRRRSRSTSTAGAATPAPARATRRSRCSFSPTCAWSARCATAGASRRRCCAFAHRGKNVADVLEMTVDEALELFRDEPAILRALGPLPRLGSATCGSGSRCRRSPAARRSASSSRARSATSTTGSCSSSTSRARGSTPTRSGTCSTPST